MRNRTSPVVHDRVHLDNIKAGDIFTLPSNPQICYMKVTAMGPDSLINAVNLETGVLTSFSERAPLTPQPDIYFGGDLKV